MIKTKKFIYGHIYKPIIVLGICASSISVHAAIISDNSERRIQIRHGSGTTNNSGNAYITPASSYGSQSNSYIGGATILSEGARRSNGISGDSMQGLI